jgi:flagellar assembly factor FliW
MSENLMQAAIESQSQPVLNYRDEDIITFEEGLVGFPSCKRFVLMENENLAPFRILQCVDDRTVGFLVLDPTMIIKNYHRSIPSAEWRSLGLSDPAHRLSLTISVIGQTPDQCSANLRAPLLINARKMVGKQLILVKSRFSVTEPLTRTRGRKPQAKKAAGN